MKTSSHISTEHLLYGAAVALAFGVRLWHLGQAPLSEEEAQLALQALDVAARHPTTLGSAPLLTALTGLAFFLLGSTDAIARLVPALLGGLLPLLAWPLRPYLGRRGALILAFALALDPGLVALSRVANSPIPAALALTAAVLAAAHNRWRWALPLAAAGMLLGPTFWLGLLSLGLGLALYRVAGHEIRIPFSAAEARQGAGLALSVLVFGGSLAFWAPEGFGAAFNSLLAFGRGLLALQAAPLALLGLALVAYAPLAVGAGLIGAGLAGPHHTPLPSPPGLLALSAALLIMFYPGRSPQDLVWVLMPLWGVAAWALAQLPTSHPKDLGWQTAVALAILSFAWFNFLAWGNAAPNIPTARLNLILGLVSLGLLVVVSGLMAISWRDVGRSWREAWGGLTWGLTLAGVALLWAATMRVVNGPREAELWYPHATTAQMRLLQQTVGDLGLWHHGRRDALQLVDLTGSKATAWAFHNLSNARQALALLPDEHPEAILTPEGFTPSQTETAYYGQDFTLTAAPLWPLGDARAVMRWLAFRQHPSGGSSVILWAREDLFPQAQAQP